MIRDPNVNPLGTVWGTLEAAHRLIQHAGWSQNRNNVGGYPIDYVAIDINDAILRCMGAKQMGAIETLYEVLGLRDRIKSIALVGWNDAWGRTRGDVDDAFDRAIELAKSREGT